MINLKNNLVALLIVLAGTFYAQNFKDSTFTDARDQNIYRVRKIGEQWWFLDNLKYINPDVMEIKESGVVKKERFKYRYDYPDKIVYGFDLLDNFIEYGGFYLYGSALVSCPNGWHLPTDEEWKRLEKKLGMSTNLLDYDSSDPAMITNKDGSFKKNYHFRGDRSIDSVFIINLDLGNNNFLIAKHNPKKYKTSFQKDDFSAFITQIDTFKAHYKDKTKPNSYSRIYLGCDNGRFVEELSNYWTSTAFDNNYVYQRFFVNDNAGFGRSSGVSKYDDFLLCRCVDDNSLFNSNEILKTQTEIIRSDNSNSLAYAKRGLELYRMGQPKMAYDDLIEALRLNEKKYNAEIDLACNTALIEMFRSNFAKYYFSPMIDTINTVDNSSKKLTYIEKAVVYDIKAVLKKHPNDAYLNYLLAFYLTYESNDFSQVRGSSASLNEALTYIKKAVESEPNNIIYYELYLEILIHTKSFAEAEPVCNKAISLDPNYGNFHSLKAKILLENKHLSNIKLKKPGAKDWCPGVGKCYYLTQADLTQICSIAKQGAKLGSTIQSITLTGLCSDLKATELHQQFGGKKFIGPRGGVYEITRSGGKKYFPSLNLSK